MFCLGVKKKREIESGGFEARGWPLVPRASRAKAKPSFLGHQVLVFEHALGVAKHAWTQ